MHSRDRPKIMEEEEPTETPPKKRKGKAKIKISPQYVDLSESELTESRDKQPLMANKLFQHYILSEDRRKALIVDLPTCHPKGALIFSDEISKEANKICFG